MVNGHPVGVHVKVYVSWSFSVSVDVTVNRLCPIAAVVDKVVVAESW